MTLDGRYEITGEVAKVYKVNTVRNSIYRMVLDIAQGKPVHVTVPVALLRIAGHWAYRSSVETWLVGRHVSLCATLADVGDHYEGYRPTGAELQ